MLYKICEQRRVFNTQKITSIIIPVREEGEIFTHTMPREFQLIQAKPISNSLELLIVGRHVEPDSNLFEDIFCDATFVWRSRYSPLPLELSFGYVGLWSYNYIDPKNEMLLFIECTNQE